MFLPDKGPRTKMLYLPMKLKNIVWEISLLLSTSTRKCALAFTAYDLFQGNMALKLDSGVVVWQAQHYKEPISYQHPQFQSSAAKRPAASHLFLCNMNNRAHRHIFGWGCVVTGFTRPCHEKKNIRRMPQTSAHQIATLCCCPAGLC